MNLISSLKSNNNQNQSMITHCLVGVLFGKVLCHPIVVVIV